MAFLSKENLEQFAEKYGMLEEISDKPWATKNKLVQARMVEDGYVIDHVGNIIPPTIAEPVIHVENSEVVAAVREAELLNKIKMLEEKLANTEAKPTADVKREPTMDESYYNIPKGKVIIAPEMAPTRIQLIKYEEDMGEDLETENVSYLEQMQRGWQPDREQTFGSYKIKSTGRRIKGQCTIPKENAGITFDPASGDMFPVVHWKGMKGYLWTHPTYPNVKGTLMATGYYYKYADLFKAGLHPDNIWYSAGKLLTVSIPVVHNVMRQIERDAERDRDARW